MEAMLQQHKDTLAEFQKLKFQALLLELNVKSDIEHATLAEVEEAAQRLIQWSAHRGHVIVEELAGIAGPNAGVCRLVACGRT